MVDDKRAVGERGDVSRRWDRALKPCGRDPVDGGERERARIDGRPQLRILESRVYPDHTCEVVPRLSGALGTSQRLRALGEKSLLHEPVVQAGEVVSHQERQQKRRDRDEPHALDDGDDRHLVGFSDEPACDEVRAEDPYGREHRIGPHGSHHRTSHGTGAVSYGLAGVDDPGASALSHGVSGRAKQGAWRRRP